MRLFIRVFLLLQIIALPVRAQYIVQGVVTDSLTREPLPYTSVYLKGTTEGGMTDDKGVFSFKTYRPEARLVISAVGYNEYTRLIHPARGERIKVVLAPTTYALNEVVVKPKRERYKKKNNPAVEFVRKMIEHRDDYSPDERDFWQRERYEKMTFAINNFDSVKQQKWLYRKFKFLTDYVDTSAVTGKPVLAVSNRELLATDYYRKSPHSEKQWVKARRQAGVDEMLSQQGMEQAISVTMTDVDIYQNNITLFTNKFVSPLSSLGPSFYKYYLMDTLTVAGKPCVDLTFVPFNSESFGFTGHLYVMLDSTYFVRRVYEIKQRQDSKAMLVLVDSSVKVDFYVQDVPEVAWDLIDLADKPLTIIYSGARNLAANLLAEDGSVGIRVTNEDFSKRLCQQFRKAVVSTSANISGQPSPRNFSEISEEVKSAVDYIVGYRQEEMSNPKPSSIIKLDKGGVIKIIRE